MDYGYGGAVRRRMLDSLSISRVVPYCINGRVVSSNGQVCQRIQQHDIRLVDFPLFTEQDSSNSSHDVCDVYLLVK